MTSAAQRRADNLNRGLSRQDIEWAVGPNDELYLRDKPSATAARTKWIEMIREDERARWKANMERIERDVDRTGGAPRA